MDARGRVPPPSTGRSVQAPGMMRHGPFPGSEPSASHRTREPLSHSELLENKIAAQAAEMERLAAENRRLAATHVGLREDLVSAHQDVQRLKAHIRSIQTESDIQIRILMDKIAKMEADIRAGESVKKDLRQAHIDARNLVMDKQELTARIQQASQELQTISSDVKKLPEMHAEIDNLRKEHERLRAIFEHEKGSNIEQVRQMQLKEKNLVSMAREVERLRIEVLDAEHRARAPAPFGGGHMVPNQSYPPHLQGTVAYIDGYGRPLPQMGTGNNPATASGEGMVSYDAAAAVGNTTASTSSSGPVWGGGHHHIQGGVAAYVDPYGRPLVQMGAEGMSAAGAGTPAVSTPSIGTVWGAHHVQGNIAYVDGYGRPLVQMGVGIGAEGTTVPHSNSNPVGASGGSGSGSGRPVDQTSAGAVAEGMVPAGTPGGAHDPALPQR